MKTRIANARHYLFAVLSMGWERQFDRCEYCDRWERRSRIVVTDGWGYCRTCQRDGSR